MKTYLLTCGCSAAIVVGPGQAGGEVVCPRCHTALPVPRLGALTRLPEAEAAGGVGGERPRGTAAVGGAGRPQTAAATPWSAAHACLLGGCLTAALTAGAAAYLGRAPRPLLDEAMIRAGVAAAPMTDIHKAWQSLARSSVSRPTMPDEERLQQVARSARGVAAVLWGIVALGTVVAIGGAIAVARAGEPRR